MQFSLNKFKIILILLINMQFCTKIIARGVSAVGSAQRWQRWGQGFESPTLHHLKKGVKNV